jgi:hypothetical protein
MANETEPGMPRNKKPTKAQGKYSKYQARTSDVKATWSAVDEALILVALTNVTDDGAALLFGTTGDGGALVLTIYDGGVPVKLYARSSEEMNDHLRKIADA